LEKFVSSQANKKEDIDKRRKRKKNVQVFGTLRATQTFANIENPDHNVNLDLFGFQDFPNLVAHEEDSLKALKSMRGHVVESLSHMRRRI
jgi:hypothetical protein